MQRSKKILIRIILFIIGPAESTTAFKGELNSIVILAQEKLGDALLLTPLVGILRRQLPHLDIHIITNSPVYSFFAADPNVNAVHRGKNHYIGLLKLVRSSTFDVLFCTKDHPSFTFLYQSRLIRARHRVGIDHPYHAGFFNHLIDIGFHRHVIEKNCALLDYVGIQYEKHECRPYLPKGEVTEQIEEFAQTLSGKGYIGINLSAGDSKREWSLSKWSEFVSRSRRGTIVIAMPDRLQDKEFIEKSCSVVLRSPTTKSIVEAGEIVRQLEVLVSPDTALIHVASCVNVKVVGLYTSDTIQQERFYPYLVPYKLCVSPSREIDDIPVAEVIEATESMLGG